MQGSSLKPPDDRIPNHNMILGVWISLILFSSTDIAARWANAFYAMGFESSGLDGHVSMFVVQKGYHIFLFAVLGWLIASASGSRSGPVTRVVLWSFVVGLLSEALQFGFQSRGPSFADVLLNGASGSTAGWIWARWLILRAKAASTVVES